ncbi:MAG: hypothetical protein RLZZ401_2191 [Pseudomonadota bacterium]|jgi:hypothetical protein
MMNLVAGWLLRWIAVCLAGMGLLGTVQAQPAERMALVIGNATYPTSPLANPRNDASAMAELLTRAGFKVAQHLDTDLEQLQAAVNKFGTAIKDPKVKFGLFYYAGHGLQQDWRNYLVPVSARIRVSADVPRQTVDVSQLLNYMEHAQGRSFLIILDACRDDPFAGTFKPPAKGLSQFDAPVGSLLAYATAPGNVAQDGTGQNGLYTSHLLREFAVPGARLEDAFKRVRLNVRLASKGQQIPWESTSLEEDLYLFPHRSRTMSDAEKDQLLEKEMTSWLRVKSSQDPEVLAGFIREFPSGSASELAQSRMTRLLSAMAARETEAQRAADQAAAQAAAQKAATELAAREEAARRAAVEAENRRLTALRAEEERVRLALAAAAREEAQRVQAALAAQQAIELAARQTAAREQATRVAAENARLAELEAQRVATAQAESARRAAEAEAQRVAAVHAEQERVRVAQAAAAHAEQARLQAIQDKAEREQAARLAADKARLETQEMQRIALAEAQAAQRAADQAEAQRLAQTQRLQAQREQAAQAAALAATRQAEATRLQQQAQAQAQAALAEAQRLQALKTQHEADERLRVQQAEVQRVELARLAEQQQREATRLATEKQAALALAAPATVAPPVALAATPFYKGYAEHVRQYSPDDQYEIRVIDVFTGATKPQVMKVTQVDLVNERVMYNDGEFVSDLMGNTTTNQRGVMSTPRQFYPADLFLGKKWTTRFKQSRANGVAYTYQYDLKVVGKESITVPAGTFDAFKIEARGYNLELNARLERNIWVAPGVNADIAQEIKVVLRNGTIEQNDRQELVSFVQAQR